MKTRDKKRNLLVRNEKCLKLNEEELQKVIGSGNSQVRYISDEYIQARILKMRINI
ncbi:MAG: hypothetical protein ACLR0O_00085 [Staphylococcus aureus]